jgi:hypothetical protein
MYVGWVDDVHGPADGGPGWDVSNCCVACANLTNGRLVGLTITMKRFVLESQRQGKLRGSSRTHILGKT